jgi:hypothetical protein
MIWWESGTDNQTLGKNGRNILHIFVVRPPGPPTDDIPWGTIALVLAIATILILLIGCQAPLRS